MGHLGKNEMVDLKLTVSIIIVKSLNFAIKRQKLRIHQKAMLNHILPTTDAF